MKCFNRDSKCTHDTYTKTEVDNMVNSKANSSDVYTKSETYTKTEVNNLVNVKANSSDVYVKGDFAVLTGTTTTSVNNSINYPSGFTMDNSVVISKALNINGWQDNISTGNATEISNYFQVILSSSKIVLNNYTGAAYNYKIVLMKIS